MGKNNLCAMTSARILFACVVVTMAASSMAFSFQPRNVSFIHRIVGGEETDELEFPFLVPLLVQGTGTVYSRQICCGTLISDRWVLTAAHCVEDNPNPTDYQVGVNLHNLNVKETEVNLGACSRVINLDRVEMHPDYNSPGDMDNDFALLHLAEDAPCQAGQTVVLDDGTYSTDVWNDYSTASDDADPPVETLVTTAGWGTLSSGGRSPEVPYSVQVPLISNTDCSADLGSGQVSDNMICAGFPDGGKDSCQGDSGGPFFKELGNGKFALLGVVSWGYGCADPDSPGVYARVSSYYEFLADLLNGDISVCEFNNGGCAPTSEGGICTDGVCGCATGYSLNSYGTCDVVCGADQTRIGVHIVADDYPEENSWTLFTTTTPFTLLVSKSAGVSGSTCVDSGVCLDFVLKDDYGDGMCCEYGQGSYKVYEGESVTTGTILAEGNFEGGDQVAHQDVNCGPAPTPPPVQQCKGLCSNGRRRHFHNRAWDDKCASNKCKGCQECATWQPQCWTTKCARNKPWTKKCGWDACKGCSKCSSLAATAAIENCAKVDLDDLTEDELTTYTEGLNEQNMRAQGFMANRNRIAKNRLDKQDFHAKLKRDSIPKHKGWVETVKPFEAKNPNRNTNKNKNMNNKSYNKSNKNTHTTKNTNTNTNTNKNNNKKNKNKNKKNNNKKNKNKKKNNKKNNLDHNA